jgi:hypothetical protein
LFLIIPVNSQDGVTPLPRRGHPNLLNGSASLNIRQGQGLAGLDPIAGRDFPPFPKVTGRIRASAGVGGTLEPEAVAVFDAALAEKLSAGHPEDPLQVPHRVFVLTAEAP